MNFLQQNFVIYDVKSLFEVDGNHPSYLIIVHVEEQFIC